MSTDWKEYERKGTSQMRPYVPGEDLSGISVSDEDTPQEGGMIARNPDNYDDQWYVAKDYFDKNLQEASDNVSLELKENFEIIEEGCQYVLPVYEVVDGKGIERLSNGHQIIQFVRGSKLAGEDVPKRMGTLHEHLLAMMIHDLRFKNDLVPSIEGSLIITKLQEALGWLRQRQIDRQKRNVVGTYKK